MSNIMNTSVSGMAADSNWLSAISQNVSNATTIGYKNVETEFSALVNQAANPTDPGMGVITSLRTLNALQGSIVNTSTPTDLAIQGAGFFIVSDASGALYLSRNGTFAPDASGNLVNTAGSYLMGYGTPNGSTSATSTSLSALQKVNITAAGLTVTPTTSGALVGNLPTITPNGAAVQAVAAGSRPSNNIATSTYTNTTSVVVYDNLGAAHTLDAYFTNTSSVSTPPTTWEVSIFDHANATAGGFPYGTAGSPPLATATLTFNSTGQLTSGSLPPFAVQNGQNITFTLSTLTQYASSFSGVGSANGSAPAQQTGVSFSPNGTLSFRYSNGPQRAVYQIPLGNVPSPNNLTSITGGLLIANSQSGQISVGTPQTNGLGALVSSARENSTVDLATELTNMIQAQSAYQANSKVFQTGAHIFDVLNQIQP